MLRFLVLCAIIACAALNYDVAFKLLGASQRLNTTRDSYRPAGYSIRRHRAPGRHITADACAGDAIGCRRDERESKRRVLVAVNYQPDAELCRCRRHRQAMASQ